ncbi:phospho-sugar mutase [Alysiella crassa]|uniref:Probable phosphomannomutase n=1 Tax=Alysiella crassa TaxID=153491 RepID=A0A376BUH9_9NEIS|nr:phospho-sugar mutase [Alysiella crassa]UOP06005.1 phospho-sugar mutase [Alysiella crassa]SSY80453.1 Probable phosphomannomutase [Alysiella crassa]
MTELHQKAQNWLAQDPDPETKAELQTLLDQAQSGNESAEKELANRFADRLQFGTAGLRGRLQAGSMGMNRVLVAQAAKGLADYLIRNDKEPSVVIGYDGRKNSQIFAEDTAQIMAGAGVKTYLLPRCLPTPVLAFALRRLDLTAGVMVTASHNPPADNGYKVYLGKQHGGGQIVSPADKDIAQQIDLATQIQINEYARSDDYTVLGEDLITQYIDTTAKIAVAPKFELNYVYTALHGVGKEVLLKTFQAAGLPLPHIVAEQAEPDAAFPTVAFPNPEEKGALDLAIALAKQEHAELIIANDPDADRFAIALPDSDGNWKSVHGNMVGCYLAWHIAQQAEKQGKKGAMACSLVSSPALLEIAKRYGLQGEETLTGFKYIAKVPDLIYGFEESLGYLVNPETVSDKDGISAAIAFVDLMGSLKAQGKSLQSYMAEFAAEFGAYASAQVSLRMRELADIPALMAALRAHPITQIGAAKVVQTKDYANHAEPAEILVYYLDNGNRVIVRPSGTEPKVKVYLDVKGTDNADAARVLAELDDDVRSLLRQDMYGKQDC